ncbi:MAG: hypothetical protein IPP67_06800 [Rhodospirillaceae bacterium]|nr:hypothetical protein [Rhodospirillaceae bacterium]
MENSNWQKALLKANEACRCGARTRLSGTCQSPAMPNGRCRMHGGKSSGAPCGKKHGKYKNGHYTKTALQQRQEFYELIRTIKSTIKNIEQIS